MKAWNQFDCFKVSIARCLLWFELLQNSWAIGFQVLGFQVCLKVLLFFFLFMLGFWALGLSDLLKSLWLLCILEECLGFSF